MSYSIKYDTQYDAKTGEWTETPGICPPAENCSYCDSYRADGSPKSAFDAPADAR